jgi:hypothetical protein
MLAQAELLALYTKRQPVLDLYQQFLKEFADYPDTLGVYQKMLPLAQDLNQPAEAEKIQKEIDRLSPQPGK